MPRDERRRKKGLNESEVATPEMEANLKAIEEDAKRAESERLRTLAEPEPKKEQIQKDNDFDVEVRRKELVEKLKPLYTSQTNKLGAMTDEGATRLLSNIPIQDLEKEAKERLPKSQAIQQVVVSANSPVTVGSTIVESISDKDPNVSSETLNQARQNAKETNNIISNEKTKIVQSLNDDIFLDPSQAQSKYISSGAISAQGQTPSYESTVSKEQLLKDQAKNASKDLDDSSNAVLEKIGIQDYYPTVGRDIAVGTFTGSRIGSQTIYTGAGGLLPMGLYDARRKALAETAKNNQAKVQEFINIGDTYEPYNEAYKAYANNILLDGAARNGWDINKINKDVNLRKQRDRLIALQKEITETSTITDEIIQNSKTKEGGTGVYYPPGVLDFAVKFRAGLLDIDEILEGRKRISNITQPLIGFSNGTKWADEKIKQWVSADSKVKVPISLKTGKELRDSDYKKIGEAVKAINDGLPDQDSYISVLKEYYGLDASVVDEWAYINQIPKGDPSREWLKSYIEKQMPDESFTNEIKTFANQNFERYKFNKEFALKKEEFALKKEQALTEHQRVQNNFNNSGFASVWEGVSRFDNLQQFNHSIGDWYQKMGLNPQVNTSGVIVGRRPIEGDKALVGTNPKSTYIVVGNKNYTPEQILNNKALSENINYPGLKAAAEAVINNQARIQASSIDYLASYYDNDGSLKAGNWKTGFGGKSKDRITLRADIEGNISLPVEGKGQDGEPIITYTVSPYRAITVGDVNSEGMRVVLDQVVGGSGSAPGKTTSRENYSYSSSSSE